MPLLRLDVIEGRDERQLRRLLDAAHRGMTRAFRTPERDRYQLLHQHKPHELIVEDSGLNIPRGPAVVVISVVSRERPEQEKLALYRALAEELQAVGVAPSDLVISITTNTPADWSFGFGRAQFLTGELEAQAHEAVFR